MFKFINDQEFIEERIHWYKNTEFNEAWLKAIDDRILVPHEVVGWYTNIDNPLILPMGLVTALSGHFEEKVTLPEGLGLGQDVPHRTIKLNNLHEAIWKKVKDFCWECKIPIDNKIGRLF